MKHSAKKNREARRKKMKRRFNLRFYFT